MSHINPLQMPDGQMIQTITIVSEAQLNIHLPNFWSDAVCNPMVAFDTEWGSNPDTQRAKIAVLALCNLKNTCLIIHLQHFARIPCIITDFFAAKYIRFVGVNISKELQKLKEDHGIEIRTSIDLSQVAADCWPAWPEIHHYGYLVAVQIPLLLCGVQLLSEFIANMEIPHVTPFMENVVPHETPSVSDIGGFAICPHVELLAFHVYAALMIGIKLLDAKQS